MKNYIGTINENLECVEDLGLKGKNHMLKVKCLNCGKEIVMRTYQFQRNEHFCPTQYLGKSNGVLTCVDDLGSVSRNNKMVHLLKVKCSRCGNYSIIRSDRIISSNYHPKSCSHCVSNLQKEIADSKYLETRHFRNRLNSIRGGANERGLEFNLTEDEVAKLLLKNCYYCGEPIADGIDRISSSIGYIPTNVVPCCKICNIMKNKFPLDTFLDKVNKIYNRFFIKSSTTIPKGSTSQANGDGSGKPLAGKAEGEDIVSTSVVTQRSS